MHDPAHQDKRLNQNLFKSKPMKHTFVVDSSLDNDELIQVFTHVTLRHVLYLQHRPTHEVNIKAVIDKRHLSGT